jgi:glycosyltransferase involved in cell wall biosynthesis
MKLLLLAPHPFFQERGTPIAVRMLASVLGAHGYEIDLLTFHEGEDVEMPNCRILRTRARSWARNIRPGFSLKKVACDLRMLSRARVLARENRYDAVHAVEESVFIARSLKRAFRLPYVYDMDSSLAEQMMEKYPLLRPLGGILRFFEKRAVRGSSGVVAVCRILEERAKRLDPGKPVLRLEDIPLPGDRAAGREDLRGELAIPGPIVLYVGNLEHYQGIGLLLESFRIAAAGHPDARLVVIGGSPRDIASCTAAAGRLGIGSSVHFIGPRPLRQLSAFLAQADVLVSPRTKGINTPMKIYSYLGSGVPVLATDLPTHTQVLDREIAMLVAPDPEAMAAGLAKLLDDGALRARLAGKARERVDREYSPEAYAKKLCAFYDGLAKGLARKENTR